MEHLKHQKYKNKRSENNFKPINVSINDMNEFEKKELTKKRAFTKNTWYNLYDWLINYILEPIKNIAGGIKDQIFLFKQEDDYYKPARVGNLWKNNYIEYESSGHRNKKLSFKEYLDKSKPYLRDIIINLQKSDTWEIQLTIAINFITSKVVDEERIMYSKSDNIELMSYDNANEVVNKVFESLISR